MFYSYEILTQRKYGVATVWLVATLGSKYGGPRLQRKDIMSVNVPKACDTVINPEAPLALRLQSSLLYGITKCYSQQCIYLFQDAKSVHTNVRKMCATTMDPATLDLGMMRKSRGSEHNVLQDDPTFSPGINLLDLGDLLSLGDSLERAFNNESLLTITDSFPDTHTPPSLNSSTRHKYHAFTEPMDNSFSTDPEDMDFRMAGFGTEGILEVPDYEFTADGSVRDLVPAAGGEPVSSKVRLLGPRPGRERLDSDSFVIAQVQRDHAEVLDQPAEYGTSNDIFSNPEQRDEYDQDGDVTMHNFDRDTHEVENVPEFGQGQDLEAGDIDAVPQRRRRAARTRQVDSTIELRSADLASWRDNYIYNMEDQSERRQLGRQGYYAKLYAKKIVLEWGIGGELRNPTLNALFSGSALMQIFAKGKKREREINNENEGRRVRNRGEYDEHNLGMVAGQDKENNEDGIEVARNAEVSYNMGDEFHTPMPWNKFLAQSSQAGSVVGLPRQSSLLSSGGMRYATPLPLMSGSFEPASFTSHGGRVSASPLARRHRQSGNLLEKIDLELGTEEEDEEKYLGSIQQGYKDYTNDNINMFEHFVPGAEVGTQKAEESQWLNEIMEKESYNFFEFMKFTIENRMTAEGSLSEFVTLDQLIIPNANRVIVAAQALQHVLLLATRGLIQVEQEKPYGDIYISLN